MLAALVVIRGRAWFTPYADPTIGLYVHMGLALLHGHLPYMTAWDFRPPGLFALYAAAIACVGTGLAWNVLTTLALLATALGLAFLAERVAPPGARYAACATASFFVLLCTENDGIAGAAEVEISAFIVWSIWFALGGSRGVVAALASGLLAACAVGCKLSALPLAVLPFALLALDNDGFAHRARRMGAYAAAFVALPAIFWAIYAHAGLLTLLVAANWDATLRRGSGIDVSYYAINARWLLNQPFVLAPQLELAPFARAVSKRASLAAWGWFLLALMAVVAEGELYQRQFVLLTAPVALLGALGFCRLAATLTRTQARARIAWAIVLALTFGLHAYFETVQGARFAYYRLGRGEKTWHADESSQVLAALESVAPGERSVLLIGQSPLVYDLLGIDSPTRFPYSDQLLDAHLSRAAGVDGAAELARLFDGRPAVVVVSQLRDFRYDPARVRMVQARLAAGYRRVFAAKDFSIFVRRRVPA